MTSPELLDSLVTSQEHLTLHSGRTSLHSKLWESSNVPGLCNEALIPSPQQFGIGRSTATATQVKAHTSVSSKLSSFQGRGKNKASPTFQRVVFLAHFEDEDPHGSFEVSSRRMQRQ